MQPLVHTAALVAAVLAASLPGGTLLAVLLWRTDLPGRGVGRALVVSLLFVPLYIQAAAWQAGFGMQGWQATVLTAAPWLVGFRGAVWVHIVAALPWVAALTAMGLKQVEHSLEEAALLEMSPGRVVRRVTLRRAAPYVLIAAAWTAAAVAGEMTVTDLFGVRTFAERLYVDLAIGGEPGDAPRLALPGVVTTLATWGLAAWTLRNVSPRPRGVSPQREITLGLGRWRWPAACLVAGALAVLVVAPLANLAYQAGVVVSETAGQRTRSWSATRLVGVVAESPRLFSRELGWSLQLGILSASAAAALAVVLAWWSQTSSRRVVVVLFLAALSLAVPGPVVGLAIIRSFDRPDWPWLLFLYDQSLAAPLTALVFRTFGAALLIVRSALARLPNVVWEAATLDGVVGWRQLAYVGLPLVRRPLAAAWLVSLALAVGELSATILVLPPRVTTLAVRISTLTHYGVEDRLAGICLAVWMFSASLGFLAAAIGGSSGERADLRQGQPLLPAESGD